MEESVIDEFNNESFKNTSVIMNEYNDYFKQSYLYLRHVPKQERSGLRDVLVKSLIECKCHLTKAWALTPSRKKLDAITDVVIDLTVQLTLWNIYFELGLFAFKCGTRLTKANYNSSDVVRRPQDFSKLECERHTLITTRCNDLRDTIITWRGNTAAALRRG